MYLDHRQTLEWAHGLAELVGGHPAVRSGEVGVFVLPSFPSLAAVVDALAGTEVRVGAQDLAWADSGAYTGEVSATQLAQVGCSLVEVGHAERRALFGESDQVIARKTAAAFRGALVPILCIGEPERVSPAEAARRCILEMHSALGESITADIAAPLVFAYEPRWAIGVADPAPPAYIAEVAERIREAIDVMPALAGSRLIYGGSAGSGLLPQLGGAVDGLFLGRSGHDLSVVERILDEAASTRASA